MRAAGCHYGAAEHKVIVNAEEGHDNATQVASPNARKALKSLPLQRRGQWPKRKAEPPAHLVRHMKNPASDQSTNGLPRPFLAAPKRFPREEAPRTLKLLLGRRYPGADLLDAVQVLGSHPAQISLCEKFWRRLWAMVSLDRQCHSVLDVAGSLKHDAGAVLFIFDKDGVVVARRAKGNRQKHPAAHRE